MPPLDSTRPSDKSLFSMYAFDPAEDSTKNKATKASRAEDIIDVSYVLSPVRVLSQKAFEQEAEMPEAEDDRPTFFVRKAMNTKADQDEGWFYDIDWQEVYERALTSGNWELQTGQKAAETRSKAAKTKPTKAKKEQKTPKRIAKKAVKEVAANLPVPKAATPRASRQSSVDTEAQEASSEEEELSSSSSEEEVSEAENYAEEDEDDSEDEGMLSEASTSSEEAKPAELSADDSEDDVFSSRTASGRKRKTSAKGPSPKKRRTTAGPVLLKPSAATLRKAKERAARQQQRLADRQARRLQPRKPHIQLATGANANASPFERARAALHVGCTPDYLPCRDEEYAEIEAYLEDAIDEGVGSCICTPEWPLRRSAADELLQTSLACQVLERRRPCDRS